MAIVTMSISSSSYGIDFADPLYNNTGLESLPGLDFGDIETGTEYSQTPIWVRHDGIEPVFDVNYYLKTIGVEWGGYVSSAGASPDPFNPNWFKNGGLADGGTPNTATKDYELMRTSALNNSEMGLRIHYDRADAAIRTNGLGYANTGLNFSGIRLQKEALDYSLSAITPTDGYIHPESIDEAKMGKSGDEAMLGLSVKMPEDIIGSGHVQFALAIKYRYTI